MTSPTLAKVTSEKKNGERKREKESERHRDREREREKCKNYTTARQSKVRTIISIKKIFICYANSMLALALQNILPLKQEDSH